MVTTCKARVFVHMLDLSNDDIRSSDQRRLSLGDEILETSLARPRGRAAFP